MRISLTERNAEGTWMSQRTLFYAAGTEDEVISALFEVVKNCPKTHEYARFKVNYETIWDKTQQILRERGLLYAQGKVEADTGPVYLIATGQLNGSLTYEVEIR